MKKILFAVVGAFVSASSSFCMNQKTSELSIYIEKWNRVLYKFEKPDGKFSTKPYKEKLSEEIGSNVYSLKAFNLFHSFQFQELVDYCMANRENMGSENAIKFMEILVLIAPIIDTKLLMPRNITNEHIKKIILLTGMDRMKVRKGIIQHPQFCFEMVFCAMVDTDNTGNGILAKISQSCERICSSLCEGPSWNGKDEETALIDVIGCREYDEHISSLGDIWPNWAREEGDSTPERDFFDD